MVSICSPLQPKQQSEAVAITHGDLVKFGETSFLCHIHPGSDTCDECEPGIVMATNQNTQQKGNPRTIQTESKSTPWYLNAVVFYVDIQVFVYLLRLSDVETNKRLLINIISII